MGAGAALAAALALSGAAAGLGKVRVPVLRLGRVPAPQRRARLDAWVRRLYRERKLSGSVLLARGDEVLFEAHGGYADVAGTRPIAAGASFNLASVSKPFTALAVVLLRHRGALRYDDAVADHLPELAYLRGVTLRHLLHHTSGVPDYMALLPRPLGGTVTGADVLALLAERRPPLRFAPGAAFAYSNTGYVLLAEVVARCSGRAFGAFLEDEVFAPAGLRETAVLGRAAAERLPQRVEGFRRRFGLLGGQRLPRDRSALDGVVGDGGVCASARDLHRWHRALAAGALVPPEAYAEAYRPGVLDNGKRTDYGFGWFVREGEAVWHAGGWLGFSSYLHRDLRDDGLVVVLDNGSNAVRVTPVGFRWSSIALNLRHALAHL